MTNGSWVFSKTKIVIIRMASLQHKHKIALNESLAKLLPDFIVTDGSKAISGTDIENKHL